MKGLIIAILSIVTGVVYAGEDHNNSLSPYIGIEGHAKQFKDAKKNIILPGFGIVAGCKLNPFVGLEAGGHMSFKSKKQVRYRNHGLYASVLGYVPLNHVSLVGGLGMAHTQVSSKPMFSKDPSWERKIVPRVSGGLLFHSTDNISTRYMIVWENYKNDKNGLPLKNSLHHQLGMLYTFG